MDLHFEVEFRTLVRAFSPNCFGKECSNDWVVTKNAMIGELAGSISAHGGESVRSSDLTGFEAARSCIVNARWDWRT